MTQVKSSFNPEQFELRNSTNLYLTPDQATSVSEVEQRVEGQLDFLAQMLGWNGPNYWGQLVSTPDQKRQLLSGTFGVYNSYVVPRIYEIRSWDNIIVIYDSEEIASNRALLSGKVVVGQDFYSILSAEREGDKIALSIGELTEDSLTQIANNVQLKIDLPSARPAPFYRPEVGISGDYTFRCIESSDSLDLSPTYDTQGKFLFKNPVLFAGAFYYFDKPVYLSTDESTLDPAVLPTYDPEKELWYFQIPHSGAASSSITAFLVLANSGATQVSNLKKETLIVAWTDPSDWKSTSVIDGFTGTWGNKGGALPFHHAFDALSIHGFNEEDSVVLEPVEADLDFDQILNFIYYTKTVIDTDAPPNPNTGDIWWNDSTGRLSVWFPDENCGGWVEIEYIDQPSQYALPQVIFADMADFRANAGIYPQNTPMRIDDVTGLTTTDNVIGVQGTLTSPSWLFLHQDIGSDYWTPDEFSFDNVFNFQADAALLPYTVPVNIYDATGLKPSGENYQVSNLGVTVPADYDVLLKKVYENDNWELVPDSILKYIAYSFLFNGPEEGQMWWDYAQPVANARMAAIYYESAWVGVNAYFQSGAPTPVLDLGVVLFYCNGVLMQDGLSYIDEDRIVSYSSDSTTGKYKINYTPKTFKGSTQLPTITISDNLTTTFRADITELVFSGITYRMVPNIHNSQTPLRLWKAQDLQVSDDLSDLSRENFVNILRADLNNGPGPENWEKFFVRMPLEYGRDGLHWKKATQICKNFTYWGSGVEPEKMNCPDSGSKPQIYEELFLYSKPVGDFSYVYSEPYLYSNVAYFDLSEEGEFLNPGVFPASDVQFDDFNEAQFVEYDPLHNRQADVTSPVNQGYGNWVGQYVDINPCLTTSGFFETDLLNGAISPTKAPIWDASIYKFAPTCEFQPESFNVDTNHYKVSYSYFVADASAAEDPFFDISQEAAWRYPKDQERTLYSTNRGG